MFGLAISGRVVRSKVSLTKTPKVDEKPTKLISSRTACFATVGLSVAPHRRLFCLRRAFEIYMNEKAKGQRSAAMTFAAFEYSWARYKMYPKMYPLPNDRGNFSILYNVLSGKNGGGGYSGTQLSPVPLSCVEQPREATRSASAPFSMAHTPCGAFQNPHRERLA